MSKKSDPWKIQLTVANNFISSIDTMKILRCIQKIIT